VNRKILIIVGDGGESYETWFAVHRFQEAGFTTHVAAPSKRRLNLVMHDFEPGWDTYKEQPGYIMESDLTFDEVVKLAFDSPPHGPNTLFTITYRKGGNEHRPEGHLVEGETVKVKKGTIFNVTATDKS